MNDLEFIKCPVCLHSFDAEKHVPKIFPNCGHTVCKECLVQVLEMDTPKCPLDKLRFDRDFRTLDAFPTNFLGKDLLEMKGKWNSCEIHQEQKKMICLTDSTLVCGNCVIFGDHKDHDVKLLSDFEDLVKGKKDQLSTISERMSKVASEFADALEEKKHNMKKIIKDRFQSLRLEISKQEFEMLLKFENIFIDEKAKLKGKIGLSLEMPFDIEVKLKEFSDTMSNPNILKIVEEDFSDLEKVFDEKLTHLKTKHTEEILELLAAFQNNLPKEDLLKGFNIIEPLNHDLAKLDEKKSSEQSLQIKEVVLPPVNLYIFEESVEKPWIYQVQGSEDAKSSTFTTTQLEQIKEISYVFQIDEDLIDETILSAITLLSKFMKNINIVHISIDASSSCEDSYELPFLHLLSTAFLQLPNLENIEEIVLEVSNAPIGDLGLIFLAENLLPRLKNLTAFSCILHKTQTTSQSLKALSKFDFLTANPNLQKFRLNIKKSALHEEGVIEILNKVPNVKDLLLGFGGTPLTDNAFDSFSNNVLPSLNKVETLEVGLWETNITDEGAEKFLRNIPNVPKLHIGLNSTKVTDAGVADFVNNKLSTMTNLKKLKFSLEDTNVSDSLLEKIREFQKELNPENEDDEEDGEHWNDESRESNEELDDEDPEDSNEEDISYAESEDNDQ